MGGRVLDSSVTALVEGLGSSEPEARLAAQKGVETLLAQHRPALVRSCRRLIADPNRADEIAQESLVLAYKKLDQFRGESSFASWLLGFARNLARNDRRKRREHLVEDGVVEASDPATGVLTQLARNERAALMRRAAANLSPLEQQAVALRYEEGLSQEEITRRLGLTDASGARGLLQRCRRKLSRLVMAELAALGRGESFLKP